VVSSIFNFSLVNFRLLRGGLVSARCVHKVQRIQTLKLMYFSLPSSMLHYSSSDLQCYFLYTYSHTQPGFKAAHCERPSNTINHHTLRSVDILLLLLTYPPQKNFVTTPILQRAFAKPSTNEKQHRSEPTPLDDTTKQISNFYQLYSDGWAYNMEENFVSSSKVTL